MAIPLSYNLRNLAVRKTTTLMTALGIALTVAVLLGIFALVQGLHTSLGVTGHPLQLIVMRQGSTAELTSVVSENQYRTIRALEGVHQLDGEPAVSYEVLTVISLPSRQNPEQEANISVRGLDPIGFKMRPEVKIAEGRLFQTGRRELVVGRGVHGVRANTSIGDKLRFGRDEWEVVGILDGGKSAFNSEIWCDGDLLASDYERSGARSSLLLRATDASTLQALQNRLEDDQRLVLKGVPEKEYYAGQMTAAAPLQALGIFVAVIMAVGSSFAAMNTMYAAVARRAKEVGMLRVLGFSRGSVLLCFLIESLLLSLLGGFLGCLMVLPLNGVQSRLGNFETFSETIFEFSVTPEIAAGGVLFAMVMGIAGGLLPARLAARQEILTSLREI